MATNFQTDARMNEFFADVVGGPGLRIYGLALCIIIGVSGTYPANADGEVRHDKFLARLADGTAERTFNTLWTQVWTARHKGLDNLKVVVCIVVPESLREDNTGYVWSEEHIQEQKRLNDYYVFQAGALSSGSSRAFMKTVPHHINMQKDMEITFRGDVRVVDSWASTST